MNRGMKQQHSVMNSNITRSYGSLAEILYRVIADHREKAGRDRVKLMGEDKQEDLVCD